MLFAFAITLGACEKLDLKTEVPSCIEKEIRAIKRKEVRNPPAKVSKWEVDGQTYYYITSDCCDQYNYLYDKDCNVVCAPDGGFTGKGDGKCPDFIEEGIWTLVWEDERN